MLTCCSGLSRALRSQSGWLEQFGWFCSSESESWFFYEQGMGLTFTSNLDPVSRYALFYIVNVVKFHLDRKVEKS